MNLTLVVLIIILIAIVALALILKKVFLYITGGIVVIIVFGIFLYQIFWYNNQSKVEVMHTSGGNFTIKMDNHKLNYEGAFYRFSSNCSEKQLFAIISKQYPQTFYEENLNEIVIVENNSIFTVKLEEEKTFLCQVRNEYIISCNTMFIDLNLNEGKYIEFPFPTDYVDKSRVERENAIIPINCTNDELKEYYNLFSNADFKGDEIKLKLDNYEVIISIKNEQVSFNVIEQDTE